MPIIYDNPSAVGAGMTNPMTTAGDIIYGGTSGAPTRLAKGTDGQVLTLASGLPSWAAASGGFDPLVAEYIVTGSARTEVTFSDLDGNADGGYVVVMRAINATANLSNISICINGDTTGANYYTQYVSFGGTTVVASRYQSHDWGILAASAKMASVSNVVVVGSIAKIFSQSNRLDGSAAMLYHALTDYTVSISNITSLTILASVANSLAIGSTFSIYRRK